MKGQLLTAILAATLAAPVALADADAIAKGKQIAWDRKKGNCLTCHAMEGGQQVGDNGPPLMMMKLRFPEKADLRAQIWDPTKRNPMTNMPPFGRNHILSEAEIDLVVEYVHSL